MAYVNSTRAAKLGLADRFAALFAGVGAALQRRRVYDQTLRELRSLSDRELIDLGLHSTSIEEIAREAAYGK